MNKAKEEYLKTSARILQLKYKIRESAKQIEELRQKVRKLEESRRAIERAS